MFLEFNQFVLELVVVELVGFHIARSKYKSVCVITFFWGFHKG